MNILYCDYCGEPLDRKNRNVLTISNFNTENAEKDKLHVYDLHDECCQKLLTEIEALLKAGDTK